MSEKIIDCIYVDQVGWFNRANGVITEFEKNGEMAKVVWYQATSIEGNLVEINGKYVVIVEFLNERT